MLRPAIRPCLAASHCQMGPLGLLKIPLSTRLRYVTAELLDKAWSDLQVWLRTAALARPPGPEATCWKRWASHVLGRARTFNVWYGASGPDMTLICYQGWLRERPAKFCSGVFPRLTAVTARYANQNPEMGQYVCSAALVTVAAKFTKSKILFLGKVEQWVTTHACAPIMEQSHRRNRH